MSKKIAVAITAVITAVGTIVAAIITSNPGSIARTNKPQDAEKNKVGIVNRNIININGSAIKDENNKLEKKSCWITKEKTKTISHNLTNVQKMLCLSCKEKNV